MQNIAATQQPCAVLPGGMPYCRRDGTGSGRTLCCAVLEQNSPGALPGWPALQRKAPRAGWRGPSGVASAPRAPDPHRRLLTSVECSSPSFSWRARTCTTHRTVKAYRQMDPVSQPTLLFDKQPAPSQTSGTVTSSDEATLRGQGPIPVPRTCSVRTLIWFRCWVNASSASLVAWPCLLAPMGPALAGGGAGFCMRASPPRVYVTYGGASVSGDQDGVELDYESEDWLKTAAPRSGCSADVWRIEWSVGFKLGLPLVSPRWRLVGTTKPKAADALVRVVCHCLLRQTTCSQPRCSPHNSKATPNLG